MNAIKQDIININARTRAIRQIHKELMEELQG